MKKIYTLALVFLFVQVLNAQSPPEWLRLELDKNKVSFAFPQNNVVDAEKREFGQRLRIIAFENGVEMEFKKVRSGSAKADFGMFLPGEKTTDNVYKVGDFLIRRSVSNALSKKFFTTLYIVDGDGSYTFAVRAKDAAKPEVARFLNSIRLDGKPLLANADGEKLPEKTLLESEIATSPEVITAFQQKRGKYRGEITYGSDSKADDDDASDPRDLSRSAIILDRPRPDFRGPQNGNLVSGEASVRIRFQMLANGEIGDIMVLSHSDKEFTKNCIESVKKIRFLPAQLNGENVDSYQSTSFLATFTVVSPMFLGR